MCPPITITNSALRVVLQLWSPVSPLRAYTRGGKRTTETNQKEITRTGPWETPPRAGCVFGMPLAPTPTITIEGGGPLTCPCLSSCSSVCHVPPCLSDL